MGDLLIDQPEAARLRKLSRPVDYQKNETILDMQEKSDVCFLIGRGLVKACSFNQNGKEDIQVIYHTDELFPIFSLVNRPSLNSHFKAFSDCQVWHIPCDEMLSLIRTDVAFSNLVLNRAIKQFSVYAARINNLTYQYAQERVAYRLLFLSARFGEALPDNNVLLPSMKQQDIADSVNLSRESVSRQLKRFEEIGYIRRAGNRLIVHDHIGLRKKLVDHDGTLFFDIHSSGNY